MLPSNNPPYYAIIEASDLLPASKEKYKRELDKLDRAGINPANQEQLAAYALDLPHSRKAILKAALSLMFDETTTRLEASARPDNILEIQAKLLNLKAMDKTLRVKRQKGTKAHVWLSREQVEQITSLPDLRTPAGRRDWVVLALLLGAGLRRNEAVTITFENIKRQPMKNGQMRPVLELKGKGDKRRVIPIQPLLEKRLREWRKEAGDGFIARAVNKSGVINGSLSDHAVNDIVKKYGAMIEVPELEAHDCRRTFARLGYDAGIPVEQISLVLGHESVETTMDYLGLDINIENSVSDTIPLKG